MAKGRYDLETMVRWYAWKLSTGATYDQADIQFFSRFKGMGMVNLGIVRQEAIQVRAITERTSMLTPDMPLRAILGTTAPPGDSTYINARVKIGRKNWKPDDKRWQYREIQWRGSWDTLWQAILSYFEFIADALVNESFGGFALVPENLEVVDITIDSSVWFQHPQQR